MPLEIFETTLIKKLKHEIPDYTKSGIPFLVGLTSLNIFDKTIMMGEIYDPREGQKYRLHGEWRIDKKRGTPYFHFFTFEILTNTDEIGIVDYIQRYVPGFGRVRAKLLFDKFGPDTIDILRSDPTAALAIPGITEPIIDSIRQHFDESGGLDPHAYAAVYGLLSDYQPSQRVVTEVVHDFGSNSLSIIKKNPYILSGYRGMGWPTVDGVAMQKIKYDRNGIHRFRAAILEAVRQNEAEGNTYASRLQIKGAVQKLCGLGGPFEEALESLRVDGYIEIEEHGKEILIAGVEVVAAEREIASRLKELMATPSFGLSEIDTTGLEDEQIDAIRFIEANPIVILTGAAGCGKTTTVVNAIKSAYDAQLWIIVNTPTGKAAKRIGEVILEKIPGSNDPEAALINRIDPSTIHRALGSIPSDEPVGVPECHAKFGRGRKAVALKEQECQLPVDMAVADEVSMIDVRLMAEWLRAIKNGARIILVGDENQLPSVDSGSVLRDLIAGGIPMFRLTQPRRNSGRIVKACHDIKDGKCPTMPLKFDPSISENWLHIEEGSPDKIAQIIIDLHSETNRDPLWDIQVISPENAKKPIACANLNRLLSAHFNPDRHGNNGEKEADDSSRYNIMDKVVRTKNGFAPLMSPLSEMDEDRHEYATGLIRWRDQHHTIGKTYVVNGDIGQVLDITEERRHKHVIVEFRNPTRLCRIPVAQAEIQLAYCVTCHKFQGSGEQVIILPVHECFHAVSRELLYTSFSRAQEVLITVGTYSSIKAAVARKTLNKRRTRLARFIREVMI